MSWPPVVGYAADADVYCPRCAAALYGADVLDDTKTVYDREGNAIGPVFASEEWDYAPTCGRCRVALPYTAIDDGSPS